MRGHEDELFTDNSKYNIGVACRNCKFRNRVSLSGKPIDGYMSGCCEKYPVSKPYKVYFEEADCPKKEIEG